MKMNFEQRFALCAQPAPNNSKHKAITKKEKLKIYQESKELNTSANICTCVASL